MKHFYRLYCGYDARWQPVLDEHTVALAASGGQWEVTAGVVGPESERVRVADRLPGQVGAEADAGWEQVTLRALRRWALEAGPDEPVLYAHSKGVTHYDDTETLLETAWRRSMTRFLVGGWGQCVKLLKDHDLVGCHWLTPETHPVIVTPIFGGNFWWARAGYLAQLPEPGDESRFHAEGWVGQANPHIADLNPGWPILGVNL